MGKKIWSCTMITSNQLFAPYLIGKGAMRRKSSDSDCRDISNPKKPPIFQYSPRAGNRRGVAWRRSEESIFSGGGVPRLCGPGPSPGGPRAAVWPRHWGRGPLNGLIAKKNTEILFSEKHIFRICVACKGEQRPAFNIFLNTCQIKWWGNEQKMTGIDPHRVQHRGRERRGDGVLRKERLEAARGTD